LLLLLSPLLACGRVLVESGEVISNSEMLSSSGDESLCRCCSCSSCCSNACSSETEKGEKRKLVVVVVRALPP
jgi:hypothetical protein